MGRTREEKVLSMRKRQTKSRKIEVWVIVCCGVEGKRLSLAGRARGKGAGRLWEGGTQKKESLGMLRPGE